MKTHIHQVLIKKLRLCVYMSYIGDTEQLAVLFANRSAALYHLKKYKLALVDIEIALNKFYPKNLCYKIYDR